MKYCPRCQQEWLDRFNFCPEDATPLTACLPDPLLGVVLNNKLEIIARIGSGSHGVVYKARHRFLNEWRAIKFLAHDPYEGEAMRRLTHSISLAERLRSDHTARLLDFDQIDDRYVVISEFAEGDSLASILRSRGALPLPVTLEILRQTALSLHEAHQNGFCHLGLKPGNVMIAGLDHSAPALSVKVCDYYTSGLAKPYASGPAASVDGNALYAAPEQLATGSGDFKSDVFALGRIAQHMIFGDLLPFRLDEWQHLRADLAARRIPETVGSLLRTLLTFSPGERPGIHEILLALTAPPSGAPVVARPPDSPRPVEPARPAVAGTGVAPLSADEGPAPAPELVPSATAAAPSSAAPALDGAPFSPEGLPDTDSAAPVPAAADSSRPTPSRTRMRIPRGLWPAAVLLLVIVFVVWERSWILALLTSLDIGSNLFLMIPLMLTGLLLLTYVFWFWLSHRASQRVPDTVPAATPAAAPPSLSEAMAIGEAASAPAAPEAEPYEPAASVPESVSAAAVVEGERHSEPAPEAPPVSEIPAIPAPAASALTTAAPEPPALGVPSNGEPRSEATPITPRFSTLTLSRPEPLRDRILSWFRPIRTGSSLFNYAAPENDRARRFSWSDWVAAFRPDFKTAPVQGSLFAPASAAAGESGTVELSEDILEILARRPRGVMPGMISSIFGDFSAMGQEMAGLRRRRALTGALSIAFHTTLAIFLIWAFVHSKNTIVELKKPEVMVTMVAPPPALFRKEEAPPREGGGGGGGGKLEVTPPSPGRIPKTDKLQLVPPDPKPRPMTSPEAMLAEPTVVVPIEIPQNKALPIGDITAPPEKTPPSSGPGQRGGIGMGKGTGVGPGSGDGVGPGSGGGIGGGTGGGVGTGQGPYVSGDDGVRDPKPIRMPRPSYTEAAQRAKIMGQVTLRVLVDRNGQVARVQLIRGLGYGLDESAIKTVQTQWRFQPGTRHGQPIDVWVEVLVGFNML